jgi:hypothetical protein
MQELAALPNLFWDCAEVGNKVILCIAVEIVKLGAGEQCCAFVDLVERIW